MQEVTDGPSGLQQRTFMHRMFLIHIHADTPARNELMKSNAVAAYLSCCWCLFQSTRCVHIRCLLIWHCLALQLITWSCHRVLHAMHVPRGRLLVPCTCAASTSALCLSVLHSQVDCWGLRTCRVRGAIYPLGYSAP